LAQVRKLKWNDLPRTTRERLSKALAGKPSVAADGDQPILAVPVGSGARMVAWGVLAALALLLIYNSYWAGLGRLYDTSTMGRNTNVAVYYTVMWFVASFAVLAALYRHILGKALPYREGLYLFGLDVVKIEVDTLTITPLSTLLKVRVTEHYRNGVYQHTSYAMDFPNKSSVLFYVKKDQPDKIQAQLQGTRKRIAQAIENKNLEELKKIDLLFDIRGEDWQPKPELNFLGEGPLTQAVPAWLGRRLPLAAAAGVFLGLLTWQGRDLHHDYRRYHRAVAENTADALEKYLQGGRRYRAQAEERLYPLLYAEVKRKGAVSEYRQMLRKYPRTPLAGKAREDIHQLIQASWDKFKTRAGTSDPKMLALMERVVAFLEQKEDATIGVYFLPPLIQSLVTIDAELRKKGVAPVATHFSPTASKPREEYIVSALDKGFGTVFPSDILQLKRITGPPPQEPTTPTIEIKYLVSPTDSVYQGRQSGRSFVGIRINFFMNLRVPGEPEGFPMMLTVLPPQRFTVSFTSSRRYASAATPGEGPSDLAVYTVMAERAFDQFHDKLAQVFFGAAPVVDDAPRAAASPEAPAAAAAADSTAPGQKPAKKKHRAH